jgi:NADP-dependent aldehyde dehydrogenase
MDHTDPCPLGTSIVLGIPARGSGALFQAEDPGRGVPLEPVFCCADKELVDRACEAAAGAFETYGSLDGRARAGVLEGIARALEGVQGGLIERAVQETGLGADRLRTELDRTTATLRAFASLVRDDAWTRPLIDRATPGAEPGSIPAHDLRSALLPLGPVAVFGASNFPLAYGVAGGDTASALAAGCPVIVKGHPSHPGTGEIAAHALAAGVRAAGIDPGVFSYLHSGGEREMDVGSQLVAHPSLSAVGFTGSFGGGMALARAAAARPVPIPVFAEMGSANPVFVLPGAARDRAGAIGELLAASVLGSSGQQCTCPGLVFVHAGSDVEAVLAERLEGAPSLVMLSRRVRDGYHARVRACLAIGGVMCTPTLAAWARSAPDMHGPVTAPAGMLTTSFGVFERARTLREEVFGPSLLVVRCKDDAELVRATGLVLGGLTTTVHFDAPDEDLARRVTRGAAAKAGRVIFNGVPTGVRVAPAMVHGGPYPATNRPDSTAVGLRAIERWTRPVCFQNAPAAVLPGALRG